MGAIVIDDSLTLANWTSVKPKDYKGTDLDNALKAWEPLGTKKLTAADPPSDLSLSGYEDCVKNAQAIVTHIKACHAQLDKVSTAAKKTTTELAKLLKEKSGDDAKKYTIAKSSSDAIGANALKIKTKTR